MEACCGLHTWCGWPRMQAVPGTAKQACLGHRHPPPPDPTPLPWSGVAYLPIQHRLSCSAFWLVPRPRTVLDQPSPCLLFLFCVCVGLLSTEQFIDSNPLVRALVPDPALWEFPDNISYSFRGRCASMVVEGFPSLRGTRCAGVAKGGPVPAASSLFVSRTRQLGHGHN